MATSYRKLKLVFKRYSQLEYLRRILMWDEVVIMPEGAAQSRADEVATLSRTTQKLLVSKKNEKLLAAAKQEDGLSDWDAANLFWMEKQLLQAMSIPLKMTEEFTKAAIISEQAWRRYRPSNDWNAFKPFQEKTFKYVKEIAERRSQATQLSRYDALLDQYAPGFNQEMISSLFGGIKDLLPPLIQKITAKQKDQDINLPIGPFPVEKQRALGARIMSALGFDFAHGRLDTSPHPFCTGSPADVRITTRYSDDEFHSSLLAICHETGHALYEQGLPRQWVDQPVGQIHSMAMHESQSLLIEMEACRSYEFFEFLMPLLNAEFGKQKAFSAQNLYRLMTIVKPDFIRVDADEATYPLHVILRFEVEQGLLDESYQVADLPAVWDELMTKYLGLSTKNNFKDGVMQDVHWPSGAFGYFPAYTIGRLIAAQLFDTYSRQQPNYREHIRVGNFSPLTSWLKENVYNYGSSLSTPDFLKQVTGKQLDPAYFLKHLERRYLGA